MLKLIFTLDYEIHGNGDGCPYKLMVEPTNRLMNLMEKYDAKLTIFADMAEIIRFKEHYEQTSSDSFHYLKIKEQLQRAVIRGHDVQLHIHSSYFNAKFENEKWNQSWEEYDFANLNYGLIYERINECKTALEEIIREKVPHYKCYAFRAANWAMQPTEKIAKALVENSIFIDSSVYKYGKQSEWVKYDYTLAYDSTFPYRASLTNICENDLNSPLWEFPIHSELRYFFDFLTPIRLFRMIRARFHKHKPNGENQELKLGLYEKLFKKHPRKFDFNQLSGGQMINQLKNIESAPKNFQYLTLIGHSKSFIPYNETTLKKFLNFVKKSPTNFTFSTYPSLDQLQDKHL